MRRSVNNFINWLAAPSQEHIVSFYSSDDELIDNLKEYISTGIKKKESCIVIATPDHVRQLYESFIDESGSEDKLISEYCAVFNAEVVLAKFMVRGMPDRRKFFASVGSLLAESTAKGKRVRAYGEMVALLWKEDNQEAAIALEELWNELAQLYSYSLYCAYPEHYFASPASRGKQPIIACHNFAASSPVAA